ncbi:MAG TPA: glycosyltransferase [Actinoplanes sp.]|nr:glycosyltransferase [Actinoplanes sp.]
MTDYDVAILGDFRFASTGVAAEVRAQAEAALSTVLLHAPSAEDRRPLPFDPAVRACLRDGVATLARDDQAISVRLLVVRAASGVALTGPRIKAERTVVVAAEPPAGAFPEVEWAPVDARVRAAMPPGCRLTAHDWHEIVDVAAQWRDGDEEFLHVLERRRGHQSHLRRLASLGVRPRLNSPARPRPTGPVPTRRLLMVGDDDALVRLTAIARRLPPDLAAVIATESSSPPIGDFLTEYLPSRDVLEEARWTALVRDRLAHLIELHRPQVVAVDGVPHEGVVAAVRENESVVWVWIRRAMWKRGVGHEYLVEGKVFDHVLEPGEFAALADDGATATDRASSHQVEPITLLDAGDLLTIAAARAELDLDERPAALIRLDDPVLAGRTAERLEGHGFQVVRATVGKELLGAFDLVVSAAGYDSYHELLRFGIPSVFVPARDTTLDDQVGRARHADASGVALYVGDPATDELELALDAAVRPEVQAALRRRCEELTFANGARAAATWLSGPRRTERGLT